MPRLRIISDLHEEKTPYRAGDDDFDILVCAGDVVEGEPAASVRSLARLAQGRPAVWVMGNHDLWGVTLEDAMDEARSVGEPLGVHLLENSEIALEGITFLGATLWTDGFLNQPLISPGHWSGLPAGAKLSLHSGREFGEPIWLRGPGIARRAKGRDIFRMHEYTVDWLSQRLEDGAARAEEMVVVTHYAPTPLSMAESWRTQPSAAMSASDTGLVGSGAARLWVHGHVHSSVDLEGDTRVVCNPRGSGFLNKNFQPNLTLELPGRGADLDLG